LSLLPPKKKEERALLGRGSSGITPESPAIYIEEGGEDYDERERKNQCTRGTSFVGKGRVRISSREGSSRV